MITGEVLIPKKLSGISLRYLKNRISVPRDMPIISARLLRQSLNKIELQSRQNLFLKNNEMMSMNVAEILS